MLEQTKKYLKECKEINQYQKIITWERERDKVHNPAYRFIKEDFNYSLRCILKYPFEFLSGIKYWKELNLIKNEGKGKKILVLGNGPSQGYLSSSSVKKFLLNGNSLMVINNFFHNEIFNEIIPTHYLFSDPFSINTRYLKNVKGQHLDNITQNQKILHEYLKDNENIKIFCPVNFISDIKKNSIKNKIFPFIESRFPLINFLHPMLPRDFPSLTIFYAIRMAIFQNFEKIFLLGVDNNYFKYLYNDEKNDIWIKETHAKNKSPWFSNNPSDSSISNTLSIYSNQFYYFYKSFKRKRKKFLNLDIYSLTDSFDKVDVEPENLDKYIEQQ